jgi:hypothetical protein
MKTFTLFRWGLLLSCLLISAQSWATHAAGGEILYEPIAGSPNRYHIIMRLFKNTENTNIDFFGDVDLYCVKDGCNFPSTGSFLAKLPRTRRVLSDVVKCGQATYETIVFEGDVTLPAGRWTLSTWQENRAIGIRNIEQSTGHNLYIESFLDNTSGLINTSPKFTSYQLPYLSGNQPQVYSSSAFDADGDSLVFQAVAPKENLGAAQQQYLCATEITSFTAAPNFRVDAATGALLPTSASFVQGDFLMPIRVDEFRKLNNVWTKIGSVTRDQVYRVYTGTNLSPSFTGLTINGATVAQTLEQVIRVNPGQTITLNLNATDPDAGQTLRFISNIPDIVPGATFKTINATQASLTWAVPANLPLGRYRLTVAVADDGCPINSSEVRTITVLVTNQVLAATTGRPLYLPASPNPFRSQVSFKLSRPQTVTITDGLGRLVEHITSRPDGTITWQPASSLAPGMYFARSADGQQLVRLVRE